MLEGRYSGFFFTVPLMPTTSAGQSFWKIICRWPPRLKAEIKEWLPCGTFMSCNAFAQESENQVYIYMKMFWTLVATTDRVIRSDFKLQRQSWGSLGFRNQVPRHKPDFT